MVAVIYLGLGVFIIGGIGTLIAAFKTSIVGMYAQQPMSLSQEII